MRRRDSDKEEEKRNDKGSRAEQREELHHQVGKGLGFSG